MNRLILASSFVASAFLTGCGGGSDGHGGSSSGPVLFTAATGFTVGASHDPSSVVTADFNGDGRLDVAVANRTTNNVTVFFGTGAGGLGAGTEFSLGAGTGPVALVAADVNGDGRLDLAVANETSDSITVLVNSGLGVFGVISTVPLSAGAQVTGIVAGDVNHDGNVDLAVSADGSDDVQIALGNGDGTFAAPVSFTLGAGFNATDVAIADLNGDADLDLVASSSANGNVAVLLGDGAGAFAAATNVIVTAGANLSSVATADLNRDGRMDLIVTNRTSGQVSVLLGTGTGTFGPATSFAAGADASDVVVADFNRDGRLDLAVTLEATGRMELLLGNGNGTFGTAIDFAAAGTGTDELVIGDFDGNGSLDVVVVNGSSDNIAILLGVPHTISINLASSDTVAIGALFEPNDVVSADFNGDGKLDIAVANRNHDSVSVSLGNGNGTFSAATETTLAVGTMPVDLVAADLNADGKIDLAVAGMTGNTVTILQGSGTGTFALTGTIPLLAGSGTNAVVAGDFDGDGNVDIAVANRLLGTASLALGNGNLTFAAPVSFPLNVGFLSNAAVAADLNADGNLDLAITGSVGGTIAILLGDGAGSFGAATFANVAGGANLSAILSADVNRDGRLDLVTVDSTLNRISVMMGNGDGTFGAALNTAVGADATALASGDFNRDGRLDLAVTLFGTGQVTILTGNGLGTFNAATTASTNGAGAVAITTGDWNGDGRLDLAVANRTAGSVGILTGN